RHGVEIEGLHACEEIRPKISECRTTAGVVTTGAIECGESSIEGRRDARWPYDMRWHQAANDSRSHMLTVATQDFQSQSRSVGDAIDVELLVVQFAPQI